MNQQSSNPYAPPVAHVDDAHSGGGAPGVLIPGGRSVPAGNATSWLGGGWEMFKQSPGAWIGIFLIFMVIYFVLSMIPLINFFVMLIFPLLAGGVMIACEGQRQTGSLQVGDLFAGFQKNAGQLVLLGLITLGFSMVMMLIAAVFIGFGVIGALMTGQDATAAMMSLGIGGIAMFAVVVFLGSILLYAACWFAPALIVHNGLSAIEAMKTSFSGCMRNIGGGFIYFILLFILSIVASIPLLLGWLVLGPVLWASVFTGYRDIFLED
ncbi:MAG: BPSS1780 family membrane protein [Rhodocyclaceae bacterium]